MAVDPLFNIADKVIVLTGACGTIGPTLAAALAERRAKLALVDLNPDAVDHLAASLGATTIGIRANVANEDDAKRVARSVVEAFGCIDVLINGHQFKSTPAWSETAENFPLDVWQQIIDVNLTGTFLMCREVGRQMLAQGKGAIINLASTYGVVSSNPSLYVGNNASNPVAYSASKGAVVMLTKYLGAYWAHRGVRVNCLSPHGILARRDETFVRRFSEMSPMGRPMAVEEIVGAVVFLASDASSYATGANLLVEGGWTAW
jgi:NAD(P)-dependent dehydrogenase (short-subunit alcohol dehydrogenase family)